MEGYRPYLAIMDAARCPLGALDGGEQRVLECVGRNHNPVIQVRHRFTELAPGRTRSWHA